MLESIEYSDYLNQIAIRAHELDDKLAKLTDDKQKILFSNELCGFVGEVLLRCNIMIDSLRDECKETIASGSYTVVSKPRGM